MRPFSLHCTLSKLVKHPPLCDCTVERIKRSAGQLNVKRHHSAPTLPHPIPRLATPPRALTPHTPKANNPLPIRTPSSHCLPPLRSQIRPHPLQQLLPRRARARQQTPLSPPKQQSTTPSSPWKEGRKESTVQNGKSALTTSSQRLISDVVHFDGSRVADFQ